MRAFFPLQSELMALVRFSPYWEVNSCSELQFMELKGISEHHLFCIFFGGCFAEF